MQSVDRKSVAQEVRAELARHTKSASDVAGWLNLPRQSVNLRLAGERSFRAEELVAIADHLGVSMDRFKPEAAAA